LQLASYCAEFTAIRKIGSSVMRIDYEKIPGCAKAWRITGGIWQTSPIVVADAHIGHPRRI
jgi:hypothetical protein